LNKVQQNPYEKTRERLCDLFDRYDTDRDGQLNIAQIYEWHKSGQVNVPFEGKTVSEFFEILDLNKDGLISKNELLTYFNKQTVKTLFQKYDEDKNGSLDTQEVWFWFKNNDIPFPFVGTTPEEFMQFLDIDGDGQVSLEELLSKADFIR